jgi:hypothetical protein
MNVCWVELSYYGNAPRPCRQDFVPLIGIVPSFITRGTPHHAARETSISEGRKLKIRILPAARNEPQLLGSFTCPQVGTWDRLFDFPSEGRHTEDFYIRKIRQLRPGLNSRTREPEASMLTTRPPKPLWMSVAYAAGPSFWWRQFRWDTLRSAWVRFLPVFAF